MKRPLIAAGIAALMLTSSMSYAATTSTAAKSDNTTVQKQQCNANNLKPPKMNRPNLDERLKLTETQKKQAHELRMKGHEKIKPVMEKIKAKHEQIRKVEESSLTQEQKDKKICAIEKDLLTLKQQARKIRMENTKEFEAILTTEQKAEFDKIKQEARARHNMKGPHGPKGPHKSGFGSGHDGQHRPDKPMMHPQD